MIFTEAFASEEASVVSDRTRFLGHCTLSRVRTLNWTLGVRSIRRTKGFLTLSDCVSIFVRVC